MRVVVALGGNALARDGAATADLQRERARAAAHALAPVADRHQLVLSHGGGPELGLLALQAAACEDVEVPPLDVLDAHAERVTGYLLEHELRNVLSPDVDVVTVLTSVEVDLLDAAFAEPSRFVGPLYDAAQGRALAERHQWVFRPDGRFLRRVVASPEPKRVLEIEPVRWLLGRGVVVICAGGAGLPAARRASSGCNLERVEAVIDADLVSELIARGVDADLLVMATDVDAVYADWGLRTQRRLRQVTPETVRAMDLGSRSMGPKVEAAARFVEATGRRAAIGSLDAVAAMVAGTGGTMVVRPD
jgi:carbamate kinase